MKVVACALLIAVMAAPAPADPLDEIGLGAAASAMANARTAMATGAEAPHSNPAGVARVARPEVLAGWQYAHHRLALTGDPDSVGDAHGVSLGLAVPFAIGGIQLAAGLAFYKPDRLLANIELQPVGEAHFVRFASALQRLVFEPVAAVSFRRFAVGAGASLLVDARSNHLTLVVPESAGEPQARASVDAALPVRAAPLVGVWWRPARALELAATIRGALSLDLAYDLRTTGDATDTVVSVRSVGTYTPLRAVLAAALHPGDSLAVTGEVAVERWSALGSAVPDVRVLVALEPDATLVASPRVPASFRNIVTTRIGLQWQTGSLRLRAGGAYLPSPVPAQTGPTSYADGARTVATLGAGIRIPPGRVLLQPIDLDVAFGWHHVEHQIVRKDMVPDRDFASAGDIVQGAVSTTVRF